LIVVVWVSTNVSAQKRPWPPAWWADTTVFYGGKNLSPAQNLKGYIVFKNGDSLDGYVRFKRKPVVWKTTGGWFLSRNKDTPSRFRFSEIKNIRVEAGCFGRRFTDLFTLPINHPKNAFWRLIAKKGTAAIYDRSMGIFSHESSWRVWDKYLAVDLAADEFNEYMYLVNNGEVIKIYGTFKIREHRDMPAELILQFINKRYRTNFSAGHFQDAWAMIGFILDRESGRSDSR